MCTCLLDEDTKASLRISQAIDRELSQFKKENAREFKLLLLGLFPVAQRDKRRNTRVVQLYVLVVCVPLHIQAAN